MAKPQPQTQGQRLKRARAARGWTQEQVAEKTGLSVYTIAALEQDNSKGSFESLEALGALYAMPPEFIRHGRTPESKSGKF